MATARPLDRPRAWDSPSYGKMIFYATVALGLWFFYWFNGIQCPC